MQTEPSASGDLVTIQTEKELRQVDTEMAEADTNLKTT